MRTTAQRSALNVCNGVAHHLDPQISGHAESLAGHFVGHSVECDQ